MKRVSRGFTLVEMMLVVGLLVGMAIFSAQAYVNKHEEKLADNHAMDLMTIANSAVSYAYDNEYKWPKESESSPCNGLAGDLGAAPNQYFDMDTSGYVTECPVVDGFSRVLTIKKHYENDDMAAMIANLLPAAKADADGTAGNGDVTMYVLKPRGGGGTMSGFALADKNISTASGNKVGAEIDKPVCASNLKLFATPTAICSGSFSGVESYSVIDDESTAEMWKIYLNVDSVIGGYHNVFICDGDRIQFLYMISCGT